MRRTREQSQAESALVAVACGLLGLLLVAVCAIVQGCRGIIERMLE